jgi:hypothetical protein
MLSKKALLIFCIFLLLTPFFTIAADDGDGANCSPGFWKQPQHFQYWNQPYDPADPYPGTNMTLLQALQGGNATRVSRFVVAGWLNEANPDAPCEDW